MQFSDVSLAFDYFSLVIAVHSTPTGLSPAPVCIVIYWWSQTSNRSMPFWARVLRTTPALCIYSISVHSDARWCNLTYSDLIWCDVLHRHRPYQCIKLMVVGREGRGKTTLLERLMERGQQTENRSLFSRRHRSSRTQLTTVGISLRDWVYRRTSNAIADIRTITYRTWDFAGQVICCHISFTLE